MIFHFREEQGARVSIRANVVDEAGEGFWAGSRHSNVTMMFWAQAADAPMFVKRQMKPLGPSGFPAS